jgi:hypothetical protein
MPTLIYSYENLINRAFFNYITTGAFTPVGPLLAPVVKHDFQMSWALLIISTRLTLVEKAAYLPAFSYPLTFSTFPLIIKQQLSYTKQGQLKHFVIGYII